jgi:hypothetical protein
MSDKQYTIADMIGAVRDNSPSDFQTAFDAIIVQSVADRVEAERKVVAQQYLNAEDESSEENEETSDENSEASAGSEV